MTNSKLLKEKIRDSGYKFLFLAEKMGLSRQGLYLKVNGTNDFTVPEMIKLCDLIGIDSLEEREEIFFTDEVDKKTTEVSE